MVLNVFSQTLYKVNCQEFPLWYPFSDDNIWLRTFAPYILCDFTLQTWLNPNSFYSWTFVPLRTLSFLHSCLVRSHLLMIWSASWHPFSLLYIFYTSVFFLFWMSSKKKKALWFLTHLGSRSVREEEWVGWRRRKVWLNKVWAGLQVGGEELWGLECHSVEIGDVGWGWGAVSRGQFIVHGGFLFHLFCRAIFKW